MNIYKQQNLWFWGWLALLERLPSYCKLKKFSAKTACDLGEAVNGIEWANSAFDYRQQETKEDEERPSHFRDQPSPAYKLKYGGMQHGVLENPHSEAERENQNHRKKSIRGREDFQKKHIYDRLLFHHFMSQSSFRRGVLFKLQCLLSTP